jgi:predicted acyl esterase
LKGQDTGILDGPPIRYVLPGAEGWRTTNTWPVADAVHRSFALRADGVLADQHGEIGSRQLMTLVAGLHRAQASPTDPASSLTWTSEPLERDLDIVGEIELRLDAMSTAIDTAWIVVLHEIDIGDVADDVTAGYLRASLREVDETSSRTGAPVLPCRTAQVVPLGEWVAYRIPMVVNARRFKAGHRMRLCLTSDDQDPATPAMRGSGMRAWARAV